jgi:hypothetical protein
MSAVNAMPAITDTFAMDQLREQAAAERDPKTVDWVEGKSDAEKEPKSGPLVSVPDQSSVSAEFRKRRLIVELQALDELEARTQYEAGKRFAELQILCERGEFLRILQENLNGKSQRSAYEYIRFYRMCEQVPALSGALEKNYKKAITLRNALHEEGLEVDALNTAEFKDITPEAIDTMSAAQLKAQVKKLTREVSAVVKEETKALIQERDALIRERDEALLRLEGRTWKAAREASLKLAELAETFARRTADLIALMPADEEVPHDLAISLETTLFRVSTAAENANREFQVRLDGGV